MIFAITLILINHFVSDFICQTDEMAINKSKSNNWLTIHVTVYALTFLPLGIWLFDLGTGLLWIVTNGFLHWATDYFTSRLNAYLWGQNKRHWFFVGIGFDQLIHTLTLIYTYQLLKCV